MSWLFSSIFWLIVSFFRWAGLIGGLFFLGVGTLTWIGVIGDQVPEERTIDSVLKSPSLGHFRPVLIKAARVDYSKSLPVRGSDGEKFAPIAGGDGRIYIRYRRESPPNENGPLLVVVHTMLVDELRAALWQEQLNAADAGDRAKIEAGGPDSINRKLILLIAERNQRSEQSGSDAKIFWIVGACLIAISLGSQLIQYVMRRSAAKTAGQTVETSGLCGACGKPRDLDLVTVRISGRRMAGPGQARVFEYETSAPCCNACYRRMSSLGWVRVVGFIAVIVASIGGGILGIGFGIYAAGLVFLVVGLALWFFLAEMMITGSFKTNLKRQTHIGVFNAFDGFTVRRVQIPVATATLIDDPWQK